MKVASISRKTLLSLSIALLACLSIPETVSGQAEKLGVVNYLPPRGWTKTPKDNVVAFTSHDQATGRFCIITVYGATPSAGHPNNDFTKEWTNLVVKPLRAGAAPQVKTESSDGWTLTAG